MHLQEVRAVTGASGRQLQKVGADAPAPPRRDREREKEAGGRLMVRLGSALTRLHMVHVLMNSSTAAGSPGHRLEPWYPMISHMIQHYRSQFVISYMISHDYDIMVI